MILKLNYTNNQQLLEDIETKLGQFKDWVESAGVDNPSMGVTSALAVYPIVVQLVRELKAIYSTSELNDAAISLIEKIKGYITITRIIMKNEQHQP